MVGNSIQDSESRKEFIKALLKNSPKALKIHQIINHSDNNIFM